MRSLFTLSAFLVVVFSPLSGQIQDNSFLIEEAYNQERGVVQHINTFELARGGDWQYGFTQEWPLGGIRHQLSYAVPFQKDEVSGTGLGDIAINYRHQLVGHPEARTVVAPRVSLLLPTGKEEEGRGSGSLGLQGNLPVTLVMSNSLVTHWNAGLTVVPSARNAAGNEATTTGFNLGGSVVWLARPSLNLLVEAVWGSDQSVIGDGQSSREESVILSPGLRMAFDTPGGLQIVPGLAYTFALDSSSGEDAVFIYLSLEHPFKR